jgi:hypothetical protein
MKELTKAQMKKMEKYLVKNCLEIYGTEEINTDEVLYDEDKQIGDDYIWDTEYNNKQAFIVYNLKTKKISHR